MEEKKDKLMEFAVESMGREWAEYLGSPSSGSDSLINHN